MIRVGAYGLILASAVAATAHAQPSPAALDDATRTTVIDEALKALDEGYVFPEAAKKMVEAIRQRQSNKEYAGAKTGPEFAELLTKHLQEVSKDKHLRVRYSERVQPKLGGGPGPTPEMEQRMRQMMKRMNAAYRKVERLDGNVGYLAVDGFADAEAAAEPAAAAMNFLANTDALIVDLRRNGGGSPHGVALLCSYFFDEKPVHLNSLYWRSGDRTEEFWTRKELAGKRYLGKDVYVLTSSRTFSGAEEFAYNLQTQKRATIVGETTGGGAHPGGGRRLHDHFTMFVPTGRAINPITKTNWEGTGVKPDVAVAADAAQDKAHELALTKALATTKDEELRRGLQTLLDEVKAKTKAAPAKGGAE